MTTINYTLIITGVKNGIYYIMMKTSFKKSLISFYDLKNRLTLKEIVFSLMWVISFFSMFKRMGYTFQKSIRLKSRLKSDFSYYFWLYP